MNALTKQEGGALAERVTREELIETLRESHFPSAKTKSIEAVLGYCRATGLDPMTKPVHIVPMPVPTGRKTQDGWNETEMRDVVMPGIGLYRTQASRTGEHIGTDEPEFGPDVDEDLDGVRVTYPAWCKVTVRRIVCGHPCTYTAKEFWKENYATQSRRSIAPNAMWRKRPYGQLAKCAEAQALRKGFPDAVGSAPTAEEMEGKSFDYSLVDTSTGEIHQPIKTPQPKSRAEPPPAEDIDYTEQPPAEAKPAILGNSQDAPAKPAAEAKQAKPVNSGQLKWIEQKVKALDLSMIEVLAKHMAESLEAVTPEQFDAIKADLLHRS